MKLKRLNNQILVGDGLVSVGVLGLLLKIWEGQTLDYYIINSRGVFGPFSDTEIEMQKEGWRDCGQPGLISQVFMDGELIDVVICE